MIGCLDVMFAKMCVLESEFSKPHSEPEFNPHEKLLDLTRKEWEEITIEVFQEIFKKSAVKRTKYEGLRRNITFLSKKD